MTYRDNERRKAVAIRKSLFHDVGQEGNRHDAHAPIPRMPESISYHFAKRDLSR